MPGQNGARPLRAGYVRVRRLRSYRRRFALALICFTLLFCLTLFFGSASFGASSKRCGPQGGSELTVRQVLTNVRKAVGYDRLKGLRPGFMVQESNVGHEEDARVMWFGAGGEFRQESVPSDGKPLGFDGKFGWQVDRTGLAAPVPQRLREKLLIPAWVRGNWWLSESAPFVFSILPAETDERRVALSMRIERGLVGAKIFLDRTTWLPASLVVEYERGPYTLVMKDYRETLGFRFPQRVLVNYRGNDSEYRVNSVAPMPKTESARFAVPPLPRDTTFDNSLPAELKVAQGVPFSKDSPGHYYVRPLVEGRDVGWFHFDTGSDTLQIDSKLADELKLPILGKSQTRGADGRPQEVTIRQGRTFQLGRMTFKNPIFLARDFSGSNAPPGEKRAGYVGYPALARAVLEVTGGGRRIALYDPASYRLERGKWQELSYIDLTPAVQCRLEGNRMGLFQLDTGHTGTVTFYDKFIRDEKLLEGRQVRDETGIGAGGTYAEASGEIEWFDLAGYRFNHPVAGFRVSGYSREGGAGVVGREFLSVFKVVFDYPHRRIAFIRDASAGAAE